MQSAAQIACTTATPADVFPLVIPANEDCTSYEGFLTLPRAGSLCTALWIRLYDIPIQQTSLRGAKLKCSGELSDLLEVSECPSSFIPMTNTNPACHALIWEFTTLHPSSCHDSSMVQ